MIKSIRMIGALFLYAVFAVISGCSTLPGGSSGGNNSSAPSTYGHTNRIAVIGDSISYGINPSTSPSAYGWVHILSNNRDSLWADTLTIIGNFAVSGDTAAGWNTTNKIQPVIDFNPDIVIVFIGANDLFGYVGGDGILSESEKLQLSNNYYGILDKVTNGLSLAKLVIVNYYDLFDGYSMLMTNPMFSAYSYLSNFSAYTIEGNSMFAMIASNRGAGYVNIYTDFMNHCYGAAIGGSGHLSPDYVRLPIMYYDIHPVTAGHQKIYEKVFSVLQSITITN